MKWNALKLMLLGHAIMGLIFVIPISIFDPDTIRTTPIGDWLLYIGVTYLMTFGALIAAFLIEKKIMGWKYKETFIEYLKTKWNESLI